MQIDLLGNLPALAAAMTLSAAGTTSSATAMASCTDQPQLFSLPAVTWSVADLVSQPWSPGPQPWSPLATSLANLGRCSHDHGFYSPACRRGREGLSASLRRRRG